MKKNSTLRKNLPYHQTDFLLLQFILSEFITSFHEIKHLHFLFMNLSFLIQTEANKKKIEDEFKKIKVATEKLSGGSHHQMKLFAWHETGLLNKLNHYCALFTKHLVNEFMPVQKIYKHANKSLLYCIELHEIVYELQTKGLDVIRQNLQLLKNIEKKIYNRMQRFAKNLPSIIKKFSDNENVIFFILRHKEDFEKLFDESFVLNLIKVNYTHGLSDVKQMLLKNYSERGFHQLLPIIIEKFQQI